MSKEYAVRRRQKNNKKSPSMSYGQDKRKTKKIMAENMRLLRMSQARRRTRNDALLPHNYEVFSLCGFKIEIIK